VGEVPVGQRRVFETDYDFYVGDLAVMPIAIQHDAVEPVAFRLYAGGRSVAVATDMGTVPKRVLRQLAGTDLLLMESNHDEEMLRQNMRYPESLKQRILGNRGHLSDDNNTPELAMHTVSHQLERQGLKVGRDILLDMAWRDRVGGYYVIE